MSNNREDFDFEKIEIEMGSMSTAKDDSVLRALHYRPRGSENAPTLIDVHGGAWINGSRLTNAHIHERLAQRGIGVFALDFRMPPVARYPAVVADVNHGIRWLKSNAKRLSVYLPKVGGLGTSSGGHLLMLNALCPNLRAYTSPLSDGLAEDASLPYAVACWPILDPWARFEMAQRGGKENLIKAHRAFFPDDETMKSGNPTEILRRKEFEELPRLLIVQGTADENVEHHRVDEFTSLYVTAGGKVIARKHEGAPHAFITAESITDAASKAIDQIADFTFSSTESAK